MTISVCIPTYNRPIFLKEAIQSCLSQTRVPNEILIGDDSSVDCNRKIIENISVDIPVKIRYFHNRPSLRQALNVNKLFNEVTSEYLILLHDDDILLPGTLERFYDCVIKHPKIDVVYGKQFIMSNEGLIDHEASDILNRTYYRTAAFSGSKLSSLESGFMQQFPNDGYMIRTEVANKIKYSAVTGDACDFDFGLRIGKEKYNTYFVDEYTAVYRCSKEAISKQTSYNGAIMSFKIVEELDVPLQTLSYKEKWLKEKAPIAIMQAIKLNDHKKAFQIYFSKWHRGKIMTLGGLKRMFHLFLR